MSRFSIAWEKERGGAHDWLGFAFGGKQQVVHVFMYVEFGEGVGVVKQFDWYLGGERERRPMVYDSEPFWSRVVR
jgi:hypothetical protein